jgi:hypothetical protein
VGRKFDQFVGIILHSVRRWALFWSLLSRHLVFSINPFPVSIVNEARVATNQRKTASSLHNFIISSFWQNIVSGKRCFVEISFRQISFHRNPVSDKSRFSVISFWRNLVGQNLALANLVSVNSYFSKILFRRNLVLAKSHLGKISFQRNLVLAK